MTKWFLCAALLAACGGGDGSSGDASAHVDAQATDGPTDGGLRPGTRIIAVGDSTTYGLGASSEANRYTAQLGVRLFRSTAANVELLTFAVPGATSDALASNQLENVRRAIDAGISEVVGPTIVVLTIGGNDIIQARNDGVDPAGAPLDNALTNLRTTVAFFRDTTLFPDGASIYLASVVDPTDGTGDAGVDCEAWIAGAGISFALDRWRAEYADLAVELGFTHVDVLRHFRGHGFHYDDPENAYYDAADPTHWFADCVHPNDVGHQQMADLFYAAINP